MTVPTPLVFYGYLPGGVPLVPPVPVNDGLYNAQDHGLVTSGALALSFTDMRVHYATLGAADTVLSLSAAVGSDVLVTGIVWLTQDGTGLRMVTFPENIRWQGGFSPSLSTEPGATDVIQFQTRDGGLTWLAAIAMQVA